MGDLTSGQLGPEASYKIELVDGNLKLTLKYSGSETEAGISVAVKPGMFLDKLKDAIPGEVDDFVIKALKAAFGV